MTLVICTNKTKWYCKYDQNQRRDIRIERRSQLPEDRPHHPDFDIGPYLLPYIDDKGDLSCHITGVF